MKHISLVLVAISMTACVGEVSPTLGPKSDADMKASTRDMPGPVPDMRMADMAPAPDASPDASGDMAQDMVPDMPPPGPALPAYMDPTYDPNRVYRGKQQDLFTCQDPAAATPIEGITLSRFQRLGSVEWVRNAGMFFNTRHVRAKTRGNPSFTADGDRNPFGVAVKGGFSTWRGQALMDKAIISGHIDLMPYASRSWVGRRHMRAQDGALDCMYDVNALPDRACIDAFVSVLLEHGVYFRAPTPEEVTQLTDHTLQEVLGDEAAIGQTREQSIELVYSAAWLTTAALHRSEWGSGAADALGRVKLTDWEIAHKVGYALKRRAPGAPITSIGYGGTTGTAYDLNPTERANGHHLDALLQAAASGTISDPQVLGPLIRSYAVGEDPERYHLPSEWRHGRSVSYRTRDWMSEGVRRFFREWLEADRLKSIFKDTPYATSKHDNLDEFIGTSGEWPRRGALNAITGSYTQLRNEQTLDRYEPTYFQQLDDTIARVVRRDTDVLKTLLTTNEFYTTTGEAVAATNRSSPHFVYNVESPVEVNSQDSRWRALPERAGILTHPVWLGAHSDNFEDGTGVIYRGYWIRKHMLCEPVDPVTGAIEAKLVESAPELRARDRVFLSTEDPSNDKTIQCRGCHGLMNSLGYPFEEFNHAGFVRFDDHGNMPDGSTTLQNMPRGSDLEAFEGRQITSSSEFTSMLGDSRHVKQCFIRHTFRYFMGRPETQADACTLNRMESAYDDSNGSFVEMLVALMTSDAFLYTRPWETL